LQVARWAGKYRASSACRESLRNQFRRKRPGRGTGIIIGFSWSDWFCILAAAGLLFCWSQAELAPLQYQHSVFCAHRETKLGQKEGDFEALQAVVIA